MSEKPYRFSRKTENLIANLRGVPEDHSPITRETKDLGSLLDRLLNRYKIGEDSLEDRIRESWTGIVGDANARYCAPARIERERTLVISVSNPIIRQELQFNQAILLKKLKTLKGGNKLNRVVFIAG